MWHDSMHFIHKFTWLLMQIKALIIPIVCMLSYFKYTSIILHNFMLWSKNTSIYGLLDIIEQYDFNPNYIWDHNYVLMIKVWEKRSLFVFIYFSKVILEDKWIYLFNLNSFSCYFNNLTSYNDRLFNLWSKKKFWINLELYFESYDFSNF